VAQGGSLSNFRNLITLAVRKGARNAVADGMALDFEGRLYVTTDLGIQVFRPDGRPITTIAVPETPANCTFGGPDMKVLYITARTNLYSIRLNATGLRYPVR
jgi:gluconolactonase